MIQVGLGILIAYLVLVAVVYLRQRSMLYFPSSLSPSAALQLADANRLQRWGQGGLRGYLRHPAVTPARATFVVFHGNAGHAIDRAFYADALVPLGYRVILAEYPGYGEKPGVIDEPNLTADAIATLAAARRTYPGRLVAWGESLGAGVLGSALVQRPELADAVVLLTPWDSLAAVAGHHYPYLPVSLMLRDRYATADNLKNFVGRQFVIVAAADRTIPAAYGMRLFEKLPGPKRLHVFVDADHNDWPSEATAPWWRQIAEQTGADD